jgi:photosystem II stability/assembly factor-like uncharacterized protein
VIFASTREATFGDDAAGIWRSSDGGESWIKTFDQNVSFISILSGDPDWVIAGGDNFFALSADGGLSWTTGVINDPIFGNPILISAGGGHSPADGMFLASADVLGPGLYRSLDEGATWQRVFSNADVAEFEESQLRHVAVSPSDPEVVYTLTGFNDGIWKSVNGGDDFYSIKTGVSVSTFVFHPGIAVNPRNSDQILIMHNVSVNGGANWSFVDAWPWDIRWYRDRLLQYSDNTLWISNDSGATWQELAAVSSPTFYGRPDNMWKSQDSLYIEVPSLTYAPVIYRAALSQIDDLLGE